MGTFEFIQVNKEEFTQSIKEAIKSDLETIIKQLHPSMSGKEFLTRQETADYFEISLPCLHDWMNKGILHPYKVGKRTYFKHSELVETLLCSNKRA